MFHFLLNVYHYLMVDSIRFFFFSKLIDAYIDLLYVICIILIIIMYNIKIFFLI